MQGFMLVFVVRNTHDFANGIGGHDTGESGSLSQANGGRGFANPGRSCDDEQARWPR